MGYGYGGHMGYGYGGPMGYGGNMMYGYGGGILWLVVIILAVVAIYYLVMRSRSIHSSQGQVPAPPTESAVDILKKRFARGEISKEEFDEMKNHLQG